ncbi:phospholipid-transporting ATPase ABCA3-like isoform X2 [Condylostylus longicornis]|uniref:phospholipid-transporting ATPase ABCA3-like isoform X2 n=1 Tax=Condylostylus longicornis TaxID=2530218 RepID=UPI00244E06A5|nr:phospholipid-transporting ATPase ABCA3-like isoform X2 [Condylostylus longicornis]
MKTSNWNKFSLLMWKNWKLQWNHKIQLLLEIVLPSIFCLLLVLVRTLVDPQGVTNSTVFGEVPIVLDLEKHSSTTAFPIKRYELVYSPESPCLEIIVQNAATWLTNHNEGKRNITIHAVKNGIQLENYMQANHSIAGLLFESVESGAEQCPSILKYSMRFPSELRQSSLEWIRDWRTNALFPEYDYGGPRYGYSDYDYNPSYTKEGFLPIQHAIGLSYINYTAENYSAINTADNTVVDSNNFTIPEIFVRRVPYPPYIDDPLLKGLESFVSLIILLSFVYPCSQTVKYVTIEKEKQLKEVMKIMGLPNWLHWTAWFIKSYLLIVSAICLIVVLLKYNWKFNITGLEHAANVAVFTHTSWSALLFFMCIYGIAAVTFCFMFATFFSKANTATAVLGIAWFTLYLPYKFTEKSYENLSLTHKLTTSIFCNSAMAYGFKIILRFEGTGEGLKWNNIFRPVNVDDNLSIGLVIGMMLISSILHMLVTLYIEQIFPGAYGVPKKWYFIFTRQFWFGNQYKGVEDMSSTDYQKRFDPKAFEVEPTNKKVGLGIKNLRKTFDDKVAVSGLTMNLYEDEITVLLGHNGAGKTTTISMLTGMIPPTSGTAILNGFDIRTNLMNARMSLGLCPQHNILFDELTVREHIIFFSRLKGLKQELVEEEVKKYVKILELEQKIDTQSQHLSGGMKRKLSIGAALCGGSKVVLCDEPTSGMDPSARRALWNLLQSEKKNRTILLSTHFMDEADVLGDRIAIMCSGDLKANGSPFYLKKKYGAGYHLICVKKEDCRPLQITNLLRKYVPDIAVESDIGSELSYKLPEKYLSIFEKMLFELEENSDNLNLSGYGISNTTLEEVFMLVGADKSDVNQNGLSNNHNGNINLDDMESLTIENDFTANEIILLSGYRLWISQWRAMLLKKFLYTFRNYLLLMIQNSVAIFFVVITVLIFRTKDRFRTLQPLPLTIDRYSETVTVMELQKQNSTFLEKVGFEYAEYSSSFGGEHGFERIEKDYFDFILNLAKVALVRVNSQYLIGATISSDKIVAWFNAQLLHIVPLSLNTVHNALLRAVSNSSNLIEVTNYPLPYSTETKLDALDTGGYLGFNLALNLSFSMGVISTFYVLFVIKERETRAKLLQFVSGVRVSIFWFSQFLADFVSYLITAIITLVTLACFQEDGMSTFAELGRTFLVLIIFGIVVLPFTYLLSFLFTVPATGFSRVSVINIFTGMALFVVVFTIGLPVFDLEETAKNLNYVFLLLPHYSLAKSLDSINKIGSTEATCMKICNYVNVPSQFCKMELLCAYNEKCCVSGYWTWKEPGIAANIVLGIVSFFGCFTMLLIKEYGFLDETCYQIKLVAMKIYNFYMEKIKRAPMRSEGDYANLDEDVINEKLRISQMSKDDIQNTNIVLDKVTKYYWNFRAVNEISVGIKSSECFGLLGVNGAGKTTTFKMMTGDERITFGQAYVKGYSLRNDINTVYRHIGYCPQFDALLEELTGRETLRIFSLLRGIPEKRINKISEELAKGFGFTKHLDKQIKNYSGGNKRKLSTSIALLGGPSVIYLDEPTTGMDPGARRQLWNKVCQIRDTGKTIVLTSHSMEECEALCTRLAIMVNGEFKCIGSTQHLKNKFSKGLVLKIKMKKNLEHSPARNRGDIQLEVYLTNNKTNIRTRRSPQTELIQMEEIVEHSEIEEIKNFVKNQFSESILKEQYQGILTFYIPLSSIRWSKIFGLMESHKEELKIEDYSISQTTLEEIFLEFAKAQKDDAKLKKKKKKNTE